MHPVESAWELPARPPLRIPGVADILCEILGARGLTQQQANELLRTPTTVHDPLRMKGMADAVRVIEAAIRSGKKIAVYGDFDADGVTATAMLVHALDAAGVAVIDYIPDRRTEGYGLHADAIRDLAARGVGTIISVDCGISSSEEVRLAKQLGLDIVVTDHHLPQIGADGVEIVAPADAVVNPKQPGETYPFDGLAGVGVAWKLLQALESRGLVARGSADNGVQLAMLGTIGDVMELRDENRTLVARGLRLLAGRAGADTRVLPGLRALVNACRVESPGSTDLAFSVIPAINAAGRMADAQLALDLFLARTYDQAKPLAAQLVERNRLRKETVARIVAEAEARVAALPDDTPAIVLASRNWDMGVVGIVAGRLAERYGRPALICAIAQDGTVRGSARSSRGVHVVRALDAARDVLTHYGGHAMAAGFSLEQGDLPRLVTAVNRQVAEQYRGLPGRPSASVDAVLDGAHLLPDRLAKLAADLQRLEPTGQGNRPPTFALTAGRVYGVVPFGKDRQHVRLYVQARDGTMVEFKAFNVTDSTLMRPGTRVDVAFQVSSGTFRGRPQVTLMLRKLRPSLQVVATTPVRGARGFERPGGAVAGDGLGLVG